MKKILFTLFAIVSFNLVYCENLTIEQKKYLKEARDRAIDRIIKNAEKNWPENYNMQKSVIDHQIESYLEIEAFKLSRIKND